MSPQIVAAIAGQSAVAFRNQVAAWETATATDSDNENPDVDEFCEALRKHGRELPILYCTESVDHWLFASDILDKWLSGHRFSLCAMSAKQAQRLVSRPSEDQENAWMNARQ